MDPFWNSVLSGAAGASIVAALNLWIGHWLAQKRDKANRKGNEEIQRRAEIRQYGTLEDQRRDIEHINKEKERIQAVKSYYQGFLKAFAIEDDYRKRISTFEVETNLFRMEVAAIDFHMAKQVERLRDFSDAFEADLKGQIDSPRTRTLQIMKFFDTRRDELFDELMNWGFSGKPRKFTELLNSYYSSIPYL